MSVKRVKKSISPSNLVNVVFNENANSNKTSETGFDYSDGILGPIGSATLCGANKPVMVCNSDTSIHYVKFGDSSVTAPTGLSNGIMIPSGQCVVLASGANTHVISDSATVGAYVAEEDIVDG